MYITIVSDAKVKRTLSSTRSSSHRAAHGHTDGSETHKGGAWCQRQMQRIYSQQSPDTTGHVPLACARGKRGGQKLPDGPVGRCSMCGCARMASMMGIHVCKCKCGVKND